MFLYSKKKRLNRSGPNLLKEKGALKNPPYKIDRQTDKM